MDDFVKKCKIEYNEVLGRYVTAAVNLKAGETILLEAPVLILACEDDKRCANCYKFANAYCSICEVFPLCNDCQQHNSYDCKLFENMKDLNRAELQKYNEISGTLKCLLLNENEETRKYYNEFLEMEAHLEERRNTEIWQTVNKKVVAPIMNSGVIKHLSFEVDENLLQRIHALIDVNCFEIRAPDTGVMRGVYTKAAIFAHSCLASTMIAIDGNYQMKIYANANIAENDNIYNCYTNVLLGNAERAQILKMGKHFHCACARCADVTELGSHMSSLICPACVNNKREGGFLINKHQAAWQCTICDHKMNSENVEKLLERAKEEIFHAKNDIYLYELLLARLGRYLHGNHYLMIDIKQNIAAILRAIIQNLAHRPGRKVYERKVHLCQEIVAVLRIIQPGISRLKAIALYELCNSYAELSRLRFNENDLSETELVEHLRGSELMLRECIQMLLYEPIETPEGLLAKSMLKELKDLQNDIKLIEENKETN